MADKKYKLTEETMNWYGHTLHRIEAIRSFADVKAGDIGGWVESELNLSHDGNAWIYDDAKVYDNALVYGDAKVFNNARVYGNAAVCKNALVYGNAEISGNASVFGNARVYGEAQVSGNVLVYDNACVHSHAKISEEVCISGNAVIHGDICIRGNAKINFTHDYIVFKNHFSSGRYFTWTRSNNMWSVGCFYGTGEELIAKAYADSDKKGKFYETYVKFVEQLKTIK